MEGGPLNVRAPKRSFKAFHTSFIKQTPNVKPFFRLGFGCVKGIATVAHQGARSRENARDLREAVGTHPSFAQYVGLDLHRRPVPRHIPVINAKGRRGNRTTEMGVTENTR